MPGEALPHVSHYFDEAHRSSGLDVVVVGGGNSAVEAALELFRAGARVTMARHERDGRVPSPRSPAFALAVATTYETTSLPDGP